MELKNKPALLCVLIVTFVILMGEGCGRGNGQFKTFANDKYHYQINYPGNWTAEGSAANISESLEMTFYTVHHSSLTKKDMTAVTVHVYNNPQKHAPRIWYQEDSRRESDGIYPYPLKIIAQSKETTVNGYPAYQIVTNDDAASYDYFIGSENLIYRVSFEKFSGDSSLPQETFDAMLSSFKIVK